MSNIIEVTPEEATEILTQGALLVDVREQNEWDEGHAQGATHLPLSELEARALELPTDRQLIIICKSGGRSFKAAEYLTTKGYDAINLAGGSLAWVEKSLPFITNSGETGSVL